jgi:uncharacterized membrane protein AbrB (regulator of aidB expression)
MDSLIERFRGLEVWMIALLVVVVLFVGFAASGYLSRWLGSIGQVATGALIGWVISRRLVRLNVSEYTEPLHRCLAGFGQALIISAGMLAVAVAV